MIRPSTNDACKFSIYAEFRLFNIFELQLNFQDMNIDFSGKQTLFLLMLISQRKKK